MNRRKDIYLNSQLIVWSLINPAACINEYVIVGPKNWKPLFFKSFETDVESLDSHGISNEFLKDKLKFQDIINCK